MNTIEFSFNWNNKLSCTAHTTLRLRNDSKYRVGETYDETLKGRKLQQVTITAIKHFKLNQINDFIGYIDTGYNANQCKDIIKRMYKAKPINWDTQELSLILLVVNKKTIEVPQAQNDKLAMFCDMYKEQTGVRYIVSRADAGKVKDMPLERSILHHYFTSENFLFKGKWSVANLHKYFNELRVEISGSGHPNHYDHKYELKLNDQQRKEYHQHLRKLGYTLVYTQGGGEKWKQTETNKQ